ncbi:hypothetical protein [Rhodanobacter sp. MP1X3]|uniref:hypothetical protein n=1 Tax=Rhodanobacter sp. MP1X3 TaxID=2723086 RepID=UPI001621431D|nr:hypothetical protein [Rhodanobacter sp. MP1X3]MBB6242585.1 hypothetical protein [Rhodanobacter sp. MP1X3]
MDMEDVGTISAEQRAFEQFVRATQCVGAHALSGSYKAEEKSVLGSALTHPHRTYVFELDCLKHI